MRNPAQLDYYGNDVVAAAQYDEEQQPSVLSWDDLYARLAPIRIVPWEDIDGPPILERSRTQFVDEVTDYPQLLQEDSDTESGVAEQEPFIFILPPTTNELQANVEQTFIAKFTPNVDENNLFWEIGGLQVGSGATFKYTFPVGTFVVSLVYGVDDEILAQDEVTIEATQTADPVVGWSGYVWFLGNQLGPYNINAISGKYARVAFSDGTVTYTDSIGSDLDQAEYFYVADKNETTGEYSLSSRTTGDIRVPFRPYYC